MNTERRHELEENSLARGLSDWGDRLKPFSNAVLMGVVALLVVYVGVSMWGSYQAKRNRAAWEAYEAAMLESDADQVLREAMSRLFREVPDVRNLIRLKAIYELLETVTDHCDDVGNILEAIVLENS